MTKWLQTLRSWKRWTHRKSASKTLNAKEVLFPPKKMIISFFQSQMEKSIGGDRELRTSTLIRAHPIRGEGQRDFLGESEGSPPTPPQDSYPDAGEARNDFGRPVGWGAEGRRSTGGGGLTRVPDLRVCKHLFVSGWHTQGGKDELTSCRGTVQSAWQKPPVRRKGGRAGLPKKGKWPPRGTGTTVLTYPGSAPR